MHKPADQIRNVALVGHRGTGKTSLHEAMLFQAGATNRLGSVTDGTTVSDADEDEQVRQMSISAALSSFEWQGRKINLLDTPGEPSFMADALGALRVCESAVFVVNAVMGVEVSTTRLWQRAAELDLARLVFVNMLDRERADFFRSLESLKSAFGPHVVATEIPIGSEHEVRGIVDLIEVPVGAALALDLRLESVMDGVLVSGTVTAPLTGECGRCLEPVRDTLTVRIQELYVYPEAGSDQDEQDGVAHLEGDFLDLTPTVRDAVVLALPLTPLCRRDCQGLCATCGERLEDLPEDHSHDKTTDARWGALSGLLEPSTNEQEN